MDRSPRHRRLTLFHTLGIDASAILTLVKPETIARIGRVWFVQREVTPNVPVKPLPTGHYGFGHIIDTLACSAQSVWWNSMVTRPEMGRFGVKLDLYIFLYRLGTESRDFSQHLVQHACP